MEMFGSVILDDFRFQQRPIIIFSSGDQFENSAEIVSTIYCVLNSNWILCNTDFLWPMKALSCEFVQIAKRIWPFHSVCFSY